MTASDNWGVAQPEWSKPDLEADVNAWVAEFAPYVLPSEPPTVPELKAKLRDLEGLRETATILQSERLDQIDPELVSTFEQANQQLDSIEDELRRRLAKLAPGDPEGVADLDTLQDRLAERKARQELGIPTEGEAPETLELKLSEGSWGAAIGIGTFGFAWTSFTTVHCVLMVGGMTKSFGWAGLGLLGFYSIFFLVGFAMLAGAFLALCSEEVEFQGRKLTVHRRFKGWSWKKTHALMAGEPARIGVTSSTKNSESGGTTAILLADENGKEICVGQGASTVVREKALTRINAYLAAQ